MDGSSCNRGAQYSMYSLENEVAPARGIAFAWAGLTGPAVVRAGDRSGVSALTTIEPQNLTGVRVEAVVRLARPRNKAKYDDR